VMGGAGIYLLVRNANERPVQVPSIVTAAGDWVVQKVKQRMKTQ